MDNYKEKYEDLLLKVKTLKKLEGIKSVHFTENTLNEILDIAIHITSGKWASILIATENRKELEFKAYKGPTTNIPNNISINEGIAGWVFSTGVPLKCNNIKSDKRWSDRVSKEIGYIPTRILCVPITIENKTEGVIEIVDTENNKDFSEEDIDILSIFADKIASLINSNRLYEEMQKKMERIEALTEISLILGSTLDLNKLLNIIMEEAKKLLDSEASSIFQIDEEKKELFFVVATGEKGETVKEIRVPLGKGIAGWVAQHGQTLFVKDVSKDPRFYDTVDKKSRFKTRSILAVPLSAKGKIIGVAEVLNKKGGETFTEEDIELFETLARHASVAMENAKLYQEINDLFYSSIKSLVTAIEAKDKYTRGHTERVTKYSISIAKEMNLEENDIKNLELAAMLHDIGKIGIPDKVLLKPGKLTDEEYEMIKTHPSKGAEILMHIKSMKNILPGIRHHHERYDGRGYPDGLSGENIPLSARIIAVADSFDAMVTDRPYRKGLPIEEAIRRLKENKGTQFDPNAVDTFIKLLNEEKVIVEK